MGYVGQAPTAAVLTADDITDGIIANVDIASDAAIALSKTALSAGTGVTLSTNTLNVDAAQTGITSLLATDIKIGEDAQTIIDFETANEIHFDADNAERVKIDATGLNVVSGSLETATIDYTDGDLAITIADGGGVTFAQNATFSGNVTLADDKVINLGEAGKVDFGDEAPADNAATGIVFSFIAGATLAIGDVVYMHTDGEVAKADADAVTSMPAIGICVGSGTDGNAVDVLVQGIMHDTSAFDTFTVGADIFVGTTAGAVSATAPSGSGDTVQKVGVALHADMVYFNFNTTEVLLA